QKHNIALTEALAIRRGESDALTQVMLRECSNVPPQAGGLELCRLEVEGEAQELAVNVTHESDMTTQALRDLFLGLRAIDAPKTLILISEGFVMQDSSALVIELGHLAAAS